MTGAGHAQIISVYRDIIRHARVFPSISRDRMVDEIRVQFRKNAKETDPMKVEEQRQMAMKGLQQLMQYTTLDKKSNTWLGDLQYMTPQMMVRDTAIDNEDIAAQHANLCKRALQVARDTLEE